MNEDTHKAEFRTIDDKVYLVLGGGLVHYPLVNLFLELVTVNRTHAVYKDAGRAFICNAYECYIDDNIAIPTRLVDELLSVRNNCCQLATRRNIVIDGVVRDMPLSLSGSLKLFEVMAVNGDWPNTVITTWCDGKGVHRTNLATGRQFPQVGHLPTTVGVSEDGSVVHLDSGWSLTMDGMVLTDQLESSKEDAT